MILQSFYSQQVLTVLFYLYKMITMFLKTFFNFCIVQLNVECWIAETIWSELDEELLQVLNNFMAKARGMCDAKQYVPGCLSYLDVTSKQ